MKWQSLEQRIRDIAALQYGKPGVKKNINGVNLDCVIELDYNRWVIVEISKQRNLEKVRTDVSRMILVRRSLFERDNIMAQCYFVCLYEPTTSMIDAGLPHHVEVISQASFENRFFDYNTYVIARSRLQFGSSVHPVTGAPDETAYVPVKYIFNVGVGEYDIEDIARALSSGRLIILTGEYGTGKSRCLREVFLQLSGASEYTSYFLAIDLKTTWGLQTGEEIIRRHFESLGLSHSADFAIRAFHNGNLKFILDGFDEVGSQAWSDNPATLRRIRLDSLRGVRDLIVRAREGVLLAGREHYFNTNDEMLECLGASELNAFIGSCKQEFNDRELEEFLNLLSNDVIIVPEWLPRRPLMCQTIASLDGDELREILEDQDGDISFWNVFIEIICRREARIREILESTTIKGILVKLARLTRTKQANVGPISYGEIQNAFEAILGVHPVEEASVILQRLPGLGRTNRESDERQFIDAYVVDGLRALDLVESVGEYDNDLPREAWSNPLEHLGQRVFAHEVAARSMENEALSYAHHICGGRNKIGLSDVVCGLLLVKAAMGDYGGLTVENGEMIYCDLSQSRPSNLKIVECIIHNFVFPSEPVDTVELRDCQIGKAYGVTGAQGVPQWARSTEIESYQSIATVSAIKNVDLSPQHRIMVTVLKKTFFQPGSGRQEAALLRGLGQVDRKGYTGRILQLLITEGLLKKVPGRHGILFVPERKYSVRVGRMLAELNLSEDPLWQNVGRE